MRDLLPDLKRWQADGKRIALATVVRTWGSAPRPLGATMAVSSAGEMSGSVSGGCVEGAVAQAALEVLRSDAPLLVEYGVADELAQSVGLACGGVIEIFIEPLSFTNATGAEGSRPPMNGFAVPFYLDYLATVTWAASGAIVGLRKGYDLTGVFTIALLSAMGGGLLRDGLFLQRLPVAVTDAAYLPLIAGAVLLVALFGKWLLRPVNQPAADWTVMAIDSIGTPAFAVVGMQLAMRAGIPLPGVLLIGVLNGTGGGMLRDVLVGDTPAIFKPGIHFASALALVCAGYVLWTRGDVAYEPAVGWSVVVVFVLLRALAVHFGLRTRAVAPREG